MYFFFFFCRCSFLLVFNLNVQYLQQTVLVVCDGRSLYSLYPEGKEKKNVWYCQSMFSFSFFFMNKINFYFCDLFIVMMLSDPSYPPNEPAGRGF